MEEKEYLYLGIYRDTDGNKILKIGTTNDLDRRKYQHNYSYKKAKTHTLPQDENFEYIWTHKLSKYNTLRYEEKNKNLWKENNIGEFVRNDRFIIAENLAEVEVKIRKTYKIALV